MNKQSEDSRDNALQRTLQFARHDLWMIEVGSLSGFRAFLTRVSRVVLIAAREFIGNRCLRQAAALTYLTIFTLPALLALVFSMAKGLNAFERLKSGPIDGFMEHAFPVEGGKSSQRIRDVVDQVFSYVERADLGLLGVFGVLFLVYSTIKMLGSVESSFNEIWGVQRSRTLVRKFTDYLAIVTIGPLMLLVGTGFIGILHSEKLRDVLGDAAPPAITALVPILSICLGMSMVLLTLPNTRVRIAPALIGGVVAGLAWQLAQVMFVEFQLGLTGMNAVFASFAAVPLLLSWIYLSWVSLFIGAEVCFAIQNVNVITGIARTGNIDQHFREALAPRLAGRVTARFLAGESPPNAVDLATDLGIAPRTATGILERLVRHRLLACTSDDTDEGFLPARDPADIRISDLLAAMRAEEGAGDAPTVNRIDERVDHLFEGIDQQLRNSEHNVTLRELALEKEELEISVVLPRSSGEESDPGRHEEQRAFPPV